MGTRADFYIGEGSEAEWLGSVAWDGYEWHDKRPNALMLGANEEHFRQCVKDIASDRDDFTSPEDGWPWPWENSRTTDFAYCFTKDGVKVFVFGHPVAEGEEFDDTKPQAEFPNMKERANVALRGPRSGLIVVDFPGGAGRTA